MRNSVSPMAVPACARLLGAALLSFAAAGAAAQAPAHLAWLDAHYDQTAATARTIWEYAEVGYQETRSSALLQEQLAAAGFAVEAGVADIPPEHRIKIARMIEAMTGGTALVESMHGAGSPQAQRVMIFREGDLQKKIRLAKNLLGLPVKEKAA